MSKGDKKRGNREVKKPKKALEKVVATAEFGKGRTPEALGQAQEGQVADPSIQRLRTMRCEGGLHTTGWLSLAPRGAAGSSFRVEDNALWQRCPPGP